MGPRGPFHNQAPHQCRHRGAAVLVIPVTIATMLIAAGLVLTHHRAVYAEARAQAAADAVALAAAGANPDAGRRIAAQNGVVVKEIRVQGNDVRAVISFAGATREATARWELVWLPPKPPS